MRSHTLIEARLREDGATALVRMLDGDQVGVRLTTPGRAHHPDGSGLPDDSRPSGTAATVHLIGTAAGPLGGDDLRITVRVGAGARLVVRGCAATLALPGNAGSAGAPGHYRVDLEVEDGAELDFAPEPTVVCAGADLRSATTVTLHGSGRVRLDERVVLGRHGEPGGDWTGRLSATRDGVPLLRTSLDATLLREAAPGTRAVLSLFDSDPPPPARAGTAGRAVATPLARGGLLVTAFGPTVSGALAERAALGNPDAANTDSRPAPDTAAARP